MPEASMVEAETRTDWLAAYAAPAGDLYLSAPPSVAVKWRTVAQGLAALSGNDPARSRALIARQIAELGLTFRMTGDLDGERDWPLAATPLIIGGDEWDGIARGLVQRARLVEAIASDVYGAQTLTADGHLPPAAIAGSRYFARRMLGRQPRSGKFLHVYAADLARGPDGRWRVLGDRLRLANGIGYALENRMAMSRLADALLSEVNVRRVADFFGSLREGIAADCRRERPRIALLTPGRFNQSYPEQAHLARYLGLPLVEGRDLLVLDGRLYIRTIAGPKRVDAVWRWIDTTALDPLNFDSRSRIGVPDVVSALSGAGEMLGADADGDLEMANWPGVEVLESPAFAAFMPRLARTLLGEDLMLPNIATWWCGQPREAAHVATMLASGGDGLQIVPAFGEPVAELGRPGGVAAAMLEPEVRARLIAAMRRRPMDYCAQEIAGLSTTPALLGDRFSPRPFTLRAFVARDGEGGWSVMPGGFARLLSHDAGAAALIGADEVSADVCVVDDLPAPRTRASVLSEAPRIWRGSAILASQAADNLFWFGRYTERAEATVRVIRVILGSSIEVDGGAAREAGVRRALVGLLERWGAIAPVMAERPLAQVCHAALAETELGGGVAALLRQGQDVALALRERFARDFWRIVRRPVRTLMDVGDGSDTQAMIAAATRLIEHFGALSGLASENMLRTFAWRFLDIGRRLERGIAICRIARTLSATADAVPDGTDAYGVLLDLADSQIAYRSRYLTGPARDPALDLVLLDPTNPRSLIFQVQRLAEHIAALPTIADDNLPEPPLLEARAALAPLESATIERFGNAELAEVEQRLLALSDTISQRFFLPVERRETLMSESLLG
jgi:uncharacterized circularly permuted ATP-grasp superfamily protein/uncharacterized alpha-E superfamily protein